MKRSTTVLAAAALCLGASFWLSPQLHSAAPQNPAITETNLKVGDMAPDFTMLSDQGGKPVKLSDYRGQKNVILAFYVLAFTGG